MIRRDHKSCSRACGHQLALAARQAASPSYGGMTGWQVALIAAAAALAAAAAAVFLDRRLASRRRAIATTARCAHPQPHTTPV